MAAGLGVEPRINGSKVRCPTIRRSRNMCNFISAVRCASKAMALSDISGSPPPERELEVNG